MKKLSMMIAAVMSVLGFSMAAVLPQPSCRRLPGRGTGGDSRHEAHLGAYRYWVPLPWPQFYSSREEAGMIG
jgi:hypothetical protein